MWDLPENTTSVSLIESLYNSGKPVALVCHAPAALKNVKAKNGSFQDGLLITGQNPASAKMVAEKIITALSK